ncbi:hypothetical protein AFEL58S_01996 [Afipia felis]
MYATRANIEALYGADELRGVLNIGSDDALSAEDITRVDQALADGSEQIDAYLGVRYVLPLPIVPGVLRSYAIDLAMYRIALRQGLVREELRTRYEDAIKFLQAVSAGKANLPGIGTDGALDAKASDGSSQDVQFVTSGRRTSRNTGLMT